ncbi:MAG: transcriptional repressor [Candidatus Saccharibacteria bacterium]|nr:transcriptional repressor [Candidatus Saccharibacteria bacterium]
MSSIYDIGDSRVIESREGADGKTIRRRRETPDGKRFTTYERVEKPNLAVVKKNGGRELFDREKLSNAVTVSVGKFFTSEVEIEQIVDNVEEAVYGLGDNEVTSKQIGKFVLEELRLKNEVAYVRFASVYYEFKTLDEFREILGQAVKSKAA